MKCQANECKNKAKLYVHAWGVHSWSGVFCVKDSSRIIKLRSRLILKYNQNLTVRPVTKLDEPVRSRKAKKSRGSKA